MIVAIPPKTLSNAQKAALAKKGYVVIEIDDPEKIRVISAEAPVQTNDYFMAGLKALATTAYDSPKAEFIKELYNRLSEAEKQALEEKSNS